MSTEENKQVLSRHYADIWNAGDLNKSLSKLGETVADNYLDHNMLPGQTPGLEGLKQTVSMLRTAFPNLHTTVTHLIAEGDKVVGHWTMRATHTGPLAFMQLPPTGKPVEFTGTDVVRMANGKIVEWWHQEDILSMMQQLGLAPAPGQ